MTNYNAYCARVGVKPRTVVEAISTEFPKFSKIQFSMVANPGYGVCLLPEAEMILVEKFGEGPGLLSTAAGEPVRRAGNSENRKKANMFRVRLDDELAARVRELMAELHYTHVQDFLEKALVALLEKRGLEDGE